MLKKEESLKNSDLIIYLKKSGKKILSKLNARMWVEGNNKEQKLIK